LGYDLDYEGDFEFFQSDKNKTFTEIYEHFCVLHPEPSDQCYLVAVLILWDKFNMTKKVLVHGSFVVVVLAVLLNGVFEYYFPSLRVMEEHPCFS